MKKIFILFCFISICFKSNAETVTIKNGKNENYEQQVKIKENLNFQEFLKNYSNKNELKNFSNGFIGYSLNKSVFVYNIISNQRISLTLDKLKRTDKIQCFSFNGQYFYVKVKGYIFVFDVNGNELASYKLADISKAIGGKLDVYGKDIFVDNNTFYLVSHDKYVLGFQFDSSCFIRLLFSSNELCLHNCRNFKFIVFDNIYVLLDKKLIILHKKSGKVLKTIFLENLYNNMCLLNSKIFLYSKNNFASIDLKNNFPINYSNWINICNTRLTIQSDCINFMEKNYYGSYIYTYFFDNIFLRYSHNSYNSACFLIKKAQPIQFVLDSFVISHVFYFDKNFILALIDSKTKKIVLIKIK